MKDLGKKVDDPTAIFADNQELAKNAKYHSRTRHIDICHHFVQERVFCNEIKAICCRTEDMVTDIMTKGLQKHTFEKMRVGFIRRA